MILATCKYVVLSPISLPMLPAESIKDTDTDTDTFAKSIIYILLLILFAAVTRIRDFISWYFLLIKNDICDDC